MRRFLMWMMICLLPLRLWAGDAMAVQHIPPANEVNVTVGQIAAHPCHGTDASAADASTHGPDHQGHHAVASEHAGVCGDCSVCHGPLAGLTLPIWTAPLQGGALPQTSGWNALTAIPLPQLKPPRA